MGNLADARSSDNGRADQSSAPNLLAAIDFTIVHSTGGVLTKTFRLNASHKPEATAAPPLTKGTAHRITLKGAPDQMASELKQWLETLSPSQAIIPAPPRAGKDVWRLVTAKEAEGSSEVIARTKRDFLPARGPALFALDLDFKTYPEAIVKRIEEAGGLPAALASVCPEIGDAACVRRHSVSTGISVLGEEPPTRPTGAHWYFSVLDGEDASGFAQRLFDRLALAGWSWGEVSKVGYVLPRGLFDLAASSDPSRLFYEANADLTSPELKHVKGARAAKVIPGGFLDTRALPALSEDEKAQLEGIKSKIERDLETECRKKRERWKAERIEQMVRKGKSPEAARKAVSGAVERHVLTGELEIYLDDGTPVTVCEILEGPAAYHKRTCADPLEPDYRGGRNIAVIYADKHPVRIFSQAHGGIDYRLERSPEDWFEDLTGAEVELPGKAAEALRVGPVAVTGRIDPQNIPARQWLIEPRVPVGDVSLIAGEPGVNKSALMIRDPLAVASGDEAILTGGIAGFPESLHRNGPVLIYNAEDNIDEMHRRLTAAMNHYKTPDPLPHPIYRW